MKRTLFLSLLLFTTINFMAQDVNYLDAEGNKQTLSSGSYWTIASQNTFSNGWFVLDKSITIDERINISGTVHLILKDGCTLTATKGIHLKEDNTLHIYGQENGTGKLTAGPSDSYLAGIGGDNHERAGTLIVNGGDVEATAGFSAAGIGGGAQGYWAGDYGHGGIVVINGGTVYAKGNQYGAGIGGGGNHKYANTAIPGEGGSVTINGGNVTAIGGDEGGYGIGPGRSSGNEGEAGTLSLGWRNKTDRIDISSVKAEVILNSEFVYEGTSETVTADNIGGKILIPPYSFSEDDIVLLEAIRSTGKQYFNTGYIHKSNTRVELDCNVEKDHSSNWEALLGGRLESYMKNAFCFFSRTDGADIPCFNRSGHEPRGEGFIYGERILLKCEGTTAEWFRYDSPNTLAGSVSTNGTADDGKTPMFLFNLNTSPSEGGLSADTSPSCMTLYSCKIYEGSTLICDFVPAQYNGETGLYDRVRKTFRGSGTSTPFEGITKPVAKVKGDVNEDGNVDISDIVAVINQIAGANTYARADVNGDLSVDISDIVAIINIIASGILEPEDDTDPAVKVGLCPDENHPHAIDFGNGVKYSCCNVGASVPWEFGGYYSWGETETKNEYFWNDYKYGIGYSSPCTDIGHDIAGTQYDVAHVLWGDKWQMPNQNQCAYLCDECSSKWVMLNGVKGILYTAPNGNSVFFPATGERGWNNVNNVGKTGMYAVSEVSGEDNTSIYVYHLNIENNTANYRRSREVGYSVRPVIEAASTTDPAVEAGLCPDTDHPHIIDLGGEMYYSCCNVGASAPWEYGGYYAWGETNEKDTYYWETYQYGSSSTACDDIGHNIAGTQYDAAYILWGGKWQMPNKSQLDFLTGKCTAEWVTVNDIRGIKYTGLNGKSIFLPASGERAGRGNPDKIGEDANYASSEIAKGQEGTSGFVSYLSLDDNSSAHYCNRSKGLSIRPVTEEGGTDPSVDAGICPDEHHPHVIDLGLDVKFSCCNVGASAPWKTGELFAWGETETKYNFSALNYKYSSNGNYQDLGSDISSTQYDVAHVKWGGEWHMPSSIYLRQLSEDCSKEQFTMKGVDGLLITGPNGAKIFLPAAGYNDEGYYNDEGTRGYYWSSNPSKTDSRALCLRFGNTDIDLDYILFRDCGLTIRPVYGQPDQNSDAAVKAGLCPDAQHPHVIDMGNGLKFSCCNVGASAPWEYGGYYAWGETEVKNYYNNDNYKHFKNLKFVDIGSNISGTTYDVAYTQVGNAWCMPTASQLQYLKNDCTGSWITLNGVNGMKFTSTNGASIFLPAAGYYLDTDLDSEGYVGEYWTSNNVSNNVNNARSMSINDSGVYIYNTGRVQGLSVRAIAK